MLINLGCGCLHPQLLWHPNNYNIATHRCWLDTLLIRFLVENISVAKGFKGVAVRFVELALEFLGESRISPIHRIETKSQR